MPTTRISHLESLFAALDQGYCLCEMIRDESGRPVDYRFLETNPVFAEMTGLSNAQGRTARELVPGLEQHWIDAYDAIARGVPARFQNGSEAMGRWFDVFGSPVPPEGCFALVFRDISSQRRAELEREEARAQAERLLVELNHRVMNTLAMIASIVRMEAGQLEADSAGRQGMARLQSRLAAVSALYRALNNAARVNWVAARPYLSQVVDAVAASVADAAQITLRTDIAAVDLPTAQAAPLGLLVNELMTNAMKYAFPDGRHGILSVTLALAQGQLALTVADDGVGIQPSPAPEAGGIGSELVEAFAEQLGGRVQRTTGPSGTTVKVAFPQAAAPDA